MLQGLQAVQQHVKNQFEKLVLQIHILCVQIDFKTPHNKSPISTLNKGTLLMHVNLILQKEKEKEDPNVGENRSNTTLEHRQSKT